MLHGLEVPKDQNSFDWLIGTLTSSVIICGSEYVILNKLPLLCSKTAIAFFLLICTAIIVIKRSIHTIKS
jgi:hypothetical protein